MSVSFIIYHHPKLSEDELIKTIASYSKQINSNMLQNGEIIIVLDQIKKSQIEKTVESTKVYQDKIIFIENEGLFAGPGKLWNKGFKISTGHLVAFGWSGIVWYTDSMHYLKRLIEVGKIGASFGPVAYSENQKDWVVRQEPEKDNYKMRLEYTLIQRGVVEELGGFETDIEKIATVDCEFLKRLYKNYSVDILKGKTLIEKKPLYQYLCNDPSKEKNINTSIILYHHESMTEDDLIITVESYKNQKGLLGKDELEIIIALDEVKLKNLPMFENLTLKNDTRIKIIGGNKSFVGPGNLWNQGVKIAKGEFIAITWTGAVWYPDSLIYLRKQVIQTGSAAVYGGVSYEMTSEINSCIPKIVGRANFAKESMTFINAIPLCYMIIRKEVIQSLKGFNESVELARVADWEFILRLIKQYKVEVFLGKTAIVKMPLSETAYQYDFKYTLDDWIRNFKESKYKIAIVSGLTENAQVQLSLINYFEQIKDPKLLSYRRFVEEDIKPEEIKDYDIVFLVRCRTLGALKTVKYCLEYHIKTIYLLDDNWFCATETYPQLENQIGKQSIPFFFFNLLIATVDALFVTNDLIKEDIQKYNTNIMRIPLNVNTEQFMSDTSRKDKQMIHIGFAGSSSKAQHFVGVFQALERIMNEYENVKLYFKGVALPEYFSKYEERVVQSAYTFDYKTYAKEISEWQYDIMISPLDDTRYINSKCPNKYLEITAAGAAGIYTDIPLYRGIIRDKENGLLINNNEQEWYNAIVLLIKDVALRNKIIQNAKQEIQDKYETKVVTPIFIHLLEEQIGRGIEQ